NELSSTEMEAWQRLIKVLTHEIMNSVSPIISLSGSLYDISKTSNAEWGTMQSGLEAIKVRSEGLLSFTQRYRKLTQIPTPEFQSVNVQGFVAHIVRLVQPEIDKRNIRLRTNIQQLTATFDPVLIEQAVINLIQNAMDAVENIENPSINIEVQLLEERARFIIQDNGSGINQNDLDKIFVPFFTTKNDGSGIGLALSRQIILLHGGQITVQSQIGNGTTFTVTL
ncbi:MAG TPA: HAMP domain-containing sensor histidine kinase, partial [Cyclobacteriaceae bacterium]